MRSQKITLNDNDREDWVRNDEGLYSWWRSQRKGIRVFVRENRDELTRIIMAQLNKEGAW